MKMLLSGFRIALVVGIAVVCYIIGSVQGQQSVAASANVPSSINTSAAVPIVAPAVIGAVSAASPTQPPSYDLIFSGEPGPDVENLHDLAADATTDQQVLDNVVAYYNANKDRLSTLWRETDPTRLAALFSMYIVHISTIYGVADYPSSLLQYLSEPRAQCGTYTYAQSRIATALGLKWRGVEFIGEHAWLEVMVDGHWEVFDATTNTWLSKGVEALMDGEQREYRQFYSPMLDATRPDARWHMAEGYNMQALRQKMPTIGIIYMPPGQLNISYPRKGKGY